MIVYINSKMTELPESVRTVEQLLDHLHIARQGTGVGINNRLIKSADWAKTFLNPEDRIMVIAATYGG